MRLFNHYTKPHRHLDGIADDAAWDALKRKLLTWLENQPGAVDVDEARAVDPLFEDQKIWVQMTGDLKLMEIPEVIPPP